MPSTIFTNLLLSKLDNFANSYTDLSREIFRDDERCNKLIHPGEFGEYRESLLKEFISIFIPETLNIGSGFAINCNGEVSTQIDIIIYDPAVTPKIENSAHQRFFPIECICAIGEVKSIMKSNSDLSEALIKLSNNKKIATRVSSRMPELKMPFSFLFCERINAEPLMANDWIVAGYNNAQIEKKYWHNVIASIHSGIHKYATMREYVIDDKVIPANGIVAEPIVFSGEFNKNFYLSPKDNFGHLISFAHDLSITLMNRKGVAPDLIAYTGEYV